MPSTVVMSDFVVSEGEVVPRVSQFAGRLGVLQLARTTRGWAWRLKGVHESWASEAETMVGAIRAATKACGLTLQAADWRMVRQ